MRLLDRMLNLAPMTTPRVLMLLCQAKGTTIGASMKATARRRSEDENELCQPTALPHSGINANVHTEPPRGTFVPAMRPAS